MAERQLSVVSQPPVYDRGQSVISDHADSDFDYLHFPEEDNLDEIDQIGANSNGDGVPIQVPFASIHLAPKAFTSHERRCFIPGHQIKVEIVDVIRPPTTQLLNPNQYIIKVNHGEQQWFVKCRYKHFQSLHEQLQLYRAKMRIPVPTRVWSKCCPCSHKQRRMSYKTTKQVLPKLPNKPEALVKTVELEERKVQLESFLQNLLRSPQFRDHHETLRFLEVSQLSFVHDLGQKGKEGVVKKRSGGRKHAVGWFSCGGRITGHWSRRWLIVKDTFIAYIRPRDGFVADVLLMDQDFQIESGLADTGVKHGLIVSNLTRQLLLKCWTFTKCRDWKDHLEYVKETKAKDFTLQNRYDSFAPAREHAYANWFVDGSGYFSAVADALDAAKEEIFITDWWLSPEIYMKRPITEGDRWRLDIILKRKADEGVKVFILLYKEFQMALGINSYYSKQALTSKNSQNIKVLRHPDSVTLWSHHEKIVCIDQQVAFLGGLDLAYGRWDNQHHSLTDLGSVARDRGGTFTVSPTFDSGVGASSNCLSDIQTPSSDTATRDITTPSDVTLTGIDTPCEITHPVPSIDTPSDYHTPPDEAPSDSHASFFTPPLSSPSPPHDVQISSPITASSIDPQPGSQVPSENVTVHQNMQDVPMIYIDEVDDMPPGDETGTLETELEVVHHAAIIDLPPSPSPASSANSLDYIDAKDSLSKSSNQDIAGGERKGEGDGPVACLFPDASTKRLAAKDGEEGNDEDFVSVTDRSSVAPDSSVTGRDVEEVGSVNSVNQNESGGSPVVKVKKRLFGRKKKHGSKALSSSAECISVPDGAEMVTSTPKVEKKKPNRQLSLNLNLFRKKNAGSPTPSRHSAASSPSRQSSHSASGQAKQTKGRRLWGRAKKKVLVEDMEDNSHDASGDAKAKDTNAAVLEALTAPVRKRRPSRLRKFVLTPEARQLRAAEKERRQAEAAFLRRSGSGPKSKAPSTPRPMSSATPWFTAKPSTPTSRRKFVPEHMKMNLINRLSHVRQKRKSKKEEEEVVQEEEEDDVDVSCFPSPSNILDSLGLQGSTKLWIGKDYCNFIAKDFVDLDTPFTDFIDRMQTPRMPWHDIGAVVYGASARDVARHFIQRWNFTKIEKCKQNSEYPLLLPKSYERTTVRPDLSKSAIMADVQIVRSVGDWSIGISRAEHSILNAYIGLINDSKHYIYIENQFFISIADHKDVENRIGEALFNRIKRAHEYKENFRVYVVLPLLPAFEGEIGTSRGTSIQAITHWNYQSISRGGKSIIERITSELKCDPVKYITFYGLRTHAELDGKYTSELVYVHSKMMIVDDNAAIIGSANINDRSMLGKRDSEIALVVKDTFTFPSRMDGKPYRAGKFAGTLRMSIFREHLGLRDGDKSIDVSDPICTNFYKDIWLKQAGINTSVYDKVFQCVPTDLVHSFEELYAYQKKEPLNKKDPDMAHEMLKKVKGFLVLLPMFFLINSNLSPSVTTKEAYVPVAVWT